LVKQAVLSAKTCQKKGLFLVRRFLCHKDGKPVCYNHNYEREFAAQENKLVLRLPRQILRIIEPGKQIVFTLANYYYKSICCQRRVKVNSGFANTILAFLELCQFQIPARTGV